mgnify:CR=1 FL=1
MRREEANRGGRIDGARKQRRKQERKKRKEERKWNNLNRDREVRDRESRPKGKVNWRTESKSNRPQSHWASRDVTLCIQSAYEHGCVFLRGWS